MDISYEHALGEGAWKENSLEYLSNTLLTKELEEIQVSCQLQDSQKTIAIVR